MTLDNLILGGIANANRPFGLELPKGEKDEGVNKNLQSFVPETDEDGATYITAGGNRFGYTLDMDVKNSQDSIALLGQYRSSAMYPHVDKAIDHIVNEAITSSEDESSVNLKFDDKSKLSPKLRKTVTEEFDNIVSMYKFNELGYDIFRRWYIDGRIYHHLVIEKGQESKGIIDIRPIDAVNIKKVKELTYKKDPETNINIIDKKNEYFIFQKIPKARSGTTFTDIQGAYKLTLDSVSYVTSGILDDTKLKIISHLHKSLKAVNQLRMMEDSLVIYRLARAPERRIFYIDVGSLPAKSAEKYVKDQMSRFKNKIVYDAETGKLKDDKKHMSMIEDFYMPRREGGRGTEITTLPGGDNLGRIEDIQYFKENMYESLNVPITRMQTENAFTMGRSSEISRDELLFQKFIDRLRTRFSYIFLDVLKKQLILKGVIREGDWDDIKNDIVVNFIRDNHFTELKDNEILTGRLTTLEQMDQFVGRYFSKQKLMREILKMSDEEIEEEEAQMAEEREKDAAIEAQFAPPEEEGGGQSGGKAPAKKPEPKPGNK